MPCGRQAASDGGGGKRKSEADSGTQTCGVARGNVASVRRISHMTGNDAAHAAARVRAVALAAWDEVESRGCSMCCEEKSLFVCMFYFSSPFPMKRFSALAISLRLSVRNDL